MAHPYGAGPSSNSRRSPWRCKHQVHEMLALHSGSPDARTHTGCSRCESGAHREAPDELHFALEAQADEDKVQRCQRRHGRAQRCRPGPVWSVQRPAEQV